MALRGVCLLVLVLVISWGNADARTSAQFDLETSSSSIKLSKSTKKSDPQCSICEQFTAQATEYLSLNKTQTEIIEVLHQACAKLAPYEDECNMLVDYYTAIFFTVIDRIDPDEFCEKVNLCEDDVSVDLAMNNQFCSSCQDFVTEVISKLNDTDTQMKVVVELLKGCNKVEQSYVKQCKKLVLQYAPLILVKGVKFLQNTDVCSVIHACKANQETLVSSA